MLLKLSPIAKLVSDPESDHYEDLAEHVAKLAESKCRGRQYADRQDASQHVLLALLRHIRNKRQRNSPLIVRGVNVVVSRSFSRYFQREHREHNSLEVTETNNDGNTKTMRLEDCPKATVLGVSAASRDTYSRPAKSQGAKAPRTYVSTYQKEQYKPAGAQLLSWLELCQSDAQRHFLRLVVQQNEPRGYAMQLAGLTQSDVLWLVTHVLGRDEVTEYRAKVEKFKQKKKQK